MESSKVNWILQSGRDQSCSRGRLTAPSWRSLFYARSVMSQPGPASPLPVTLYAIGFLFVWAVLLAVVWRHNQSVYPIPLCFQIRVVCLSHREQQPRDEHTSPESLGYALAIREIRCQRTNE